MKKDTDSHTLDMRARRAAAQVGLRAIKTKHRRGSVSNRGQFRLIDATGNVILGPKFDATAQEVLDHCLAIETPEETPAQGHTLPHTVAQPTAPAVTTPTPAPNGTPPHTSSQTLPPRLAAQRDAFVVNDPWTYDAIDSETYLGFNRRTWFNAGMGGRTPHADLLHLCGMAEAVERWRRSKVFDHIEVLGSVPEHWNFPDASELEEQWKRDNPERAAERQAERQAAEDAKAQKRRARRKRP